MSKNINKDQINFFHENGYVVIENVLGEKECDEKIKFLERHANKDYSAILNPDRIEFLISQSAENFAKKEMLFDKVSYYDTCKETSASLRELLKNPKSVDILETLYKSEMSGVMTQVIFKKSMSRYASQGWTPHQDNAYIKNKKGLYVTLNYFLEKATIENGTLYIYPKSHKLGIFESEDKISFKEKKGENPGKTISDEILNKFEKVKVDFNKGSMLILHGNCIHGSEPNLSKNKDRPIIMATYIPKGEYFFPGKNAQRKEIPLH
jgi:ectoine hydroxylase-related dioxygenase (phytanoyl-CoA dioxygenase family)